MTPRVAATVAVRIIALLLLIWALSDFAAMVLLRLSSHSVGHGLNPNPIIAPSFDRTHSAPPAFAFLWSMFPIDVIRLAGGLLLFSFAKPLGKLVARGLE
jgi:hypothetical protein